MLRSGGYLKENSHGKDIVYSLWRRRAALNGGHRLTIYGEYKGTTAGYKADFAYRKLIQFLVWSAVDPDKAIILGGDWRVPVLAGLQDKDFIKDQSRDNTIDDATFDREFMSKWSGTSEDAFFSSYAFDRARVWKKPEYEASRKSGDGTFYVAAMDVARFNDNKGGRDDGCNSVIEVLKITPRKKGEGFNISLVNMFTFGNLHFEKQAILLKQIAKRYNCKRCIVDGNGLSKNLAHLKFL